jgi:putative oxidoreductase
MSVRDYLEKGRDLAERIPYSLIALASRCAVADVFWRSGRTKVNGLSIREETFYLFREEYKVPLLPPDVAAYLSTISEHVFPVLLFVGLASRLSAVALFGMTMVI